MPAARQYPRTISLAYTMVRHNHRSIAAISAGQTRPMPSPEARLQSLLQRIESARRDAGQAGHVGLLAVSKTQSADAIRALASAGQRAFGENYVQEAASKQDALRELTIEWHLIGQ